jgi:hypothetical protein
MSVVAKVVLRANPDYELVLLDRLGAAERDRVGGGPEVYGLLRPRPGSRPGSQLEPRSASSDTALLFLTLREPSLLPSYVRGRLGRETDRVVTRLILDGVLEIEHRGEFVCGGRAADTILWDRSAAGSGRIGELSRDAVVYGQELTALGLTEDEVAGRLYSYGRRPVTPSLARRLGDAAAIDAELGIDAGGEARGGLDAGWVESAGRPGERVHWRSWTARAAQASQGGGYKLYVSPTVDAAGPAFVAVAGLPASARGIAAFKVAAGVQGLCRPDKLVVYFDRLDDLHEAAVCLRDELEGCPAQGVPFTAALTSDGLLSWGADPPAGEDGRTSWRWWVSQRLAEYLGRGLSGNVEPWRFALERLRLTGVDTDTWAPSSRMWEEALASA